MYVRMYVCIYILYPYISIIEHFHITDPEERKNVGSEAPAPETASSAAAKMPGLAAPD